MPSVVYRSEAETFRGLLLDVSGRKLCKQRSWRSNANIYWATVRRNLTWEWKIGEFGSCRQIKIWIAALKFDKFCNRKFDKRRILFSTGFVERLRYAFIIRGFGWLSSFWISPWLKLSHKMIYSFSVDFAAVLTLVPAFHLAILVFPICHGNFP